MHRLLRHFTLRMLTGFVGTALLLPTAVSAEPRQIHVTHPLHYGSLTISARIPLALDPLPFFELRPLPTPSNYVDRLLAALPYYPLTPHDGMLIATDGQVVRAFADPQSGDASLVPDLNRPHSSVVKAEATDVAAAALKQELLIPADDTQTRLGNEIPVFGAAAQRSLDRPEAITLVHPRDLEFTFVAVQRYAAGHPVYGKGSRMVFSVSPDGKVVGFLRRWRAASRSKRMTPITPHPSDIVRRIREELRPYTATNRVNVTTLEEAYYDSNKRYLQPILRYTASLTPLHGAIPPAQIYGYVPLCNVAEPIPILDARVAGDEAPQTPQLPGPPHQNPPLFVQEERGNVNDLGVHNTPITLGEYVNRDANMLDMANDFRDGIAGTLGGVHLGTSIARTQWYWAEPYEITSTAANAYLNNVDIAYTQPYGDWYRATTQANDTDAWQIDKGDVHLGAAAKGRLATWIIDAGGVVPSYDDIAASKQDGIGAFTPWFSIFQGLHNAVGFRTQKWLHDGLNVPFSQAAGLGLDVNASWFQEIAADSNYNGDAAYFEPHLGHYAHLGRASVFVDARNAGHSIYDVAAQSHATVLWHFWMGE